MPPPLGEHVTHILLAEFDIDKGSSLAHQYPEPTDPSIECLASLYQAVNSMDCKLMPIFNAHEKAILRASENKDMFEEKFVAYENSRKHIQEGSTISLNEQLSDDSSGKGLGIINENSESFGSGDYVIVSEEEREKLKRGTYIDLAPNLSKNKDRHFFETKVVYNGIKLPIRVPLTVNPEEVGDVIADYVLSACAMGSGSGGVLRGFTERAFPYTNLTNVDDLLKVIFEDHSTWWDVLCNIDTGKIIVSKDIATPSYGTKPDEKHEEGMRSPSSKTESWGREKWDTTDNEFMAEVMHAIQHHYGETAIRGKFQEYVQRFVRLTALYEVETFGSTKIGMMPEDTDFPGILGTGLAFQDENSKHRELAANINRIEGWRQTISYKYYQLDFQNYLKTRNIKSFDVHHQVSKLKMLKNMPEQEVETLFKAFVNSVSTDEQIIE
ncbi:13259_t:CDS:2, partial [Racocetra fulgida]